MKNYLIALFLFLILLPCFSTATGRSYLYREITGEKSKEFKWELLDKGDEVIITSSSAEGKFVNVCRRDGATLRWHVQLSPDTDIQAERIANTITLRGRFQGKKVDKSIEIDERPWFQSLSFSLRSLTGGDTKALSFWIIRKDTLEFVKMQAKSQGIEPIELAGEEVRACKVEIRKNGLLSSLWSANYWFRTSDNTFVQYRGTHGLPGTSETHITLCRPDLVRVDSDIHIFHNRLLTQPTSSPASLQSKPIPPPKKTWRRFCIIIAERSLISHDCIDNGIMKV